MGHHHRWVRTMGSRAGAPLKPAFAVNHASQLTVLPSGAVLCAWVSGDAEGADGTALVVSRLLVRTTLPFTTIVSENVGRVLTDGYSSRRRTGPSIGKEIAADL